MSKYTPIIQFKFEEKIYQVDIKAVETSIIELPDGRKVGVHGWLESMPPMPISLQLLNKPNNKLAYLATEIIPT